MRLQYVSLLLLLFLLSFSKGEPIVNHDLLAALANLMPGESHELQPPSTEHPGIVIHTAKVKDENDSDDDESEPASQRIIQTKCPERT